MSSLSEYLDNDCEFTIEVNPETINEDKIRVFNKYGINRVSIGVQSFDENILRFLNRNQNYGNVEECVILLNKYGINNYSFDFIYGIKEQNINMIENDLNLAIKLKPMHLSFYSLILEDNTLIKIHNYKEADEDIVREQYDFIY